jgi:hypothetical protein
MKSNRNKEKGCGDVKRGDRETIMPRGIVLGGKTNSSHRTKEIGHQKIRARKKEKFLQQ